MSNPVRGVNVGGWLVLEKWLTPGVFAGTNAADEYSFMRQKAAKRRIAEHRNTFITEDDFDWMARHGIGVVRIPVGYWLFDAVDGFEPTVRYLDKAMKWAHRHGVGVLIDLHAVRGSQNGFDNSGRVGRARWFTNAGYRKQTMQLLRRIAKRYKDSPALWGIEIINEPVPGRHHLMLMRFYRDAYRMLGTILHSDTTIVFHDAFRPIPYMWSFVGVQKSNPIVMDVHWYGYDLKTNSLSNYLQRSALIRKLLLSVIQWRQPVIVGEWSSVLPQRFFDAVPVREHNELLRQNIVMQQRIYKHAAGWMYWNYKAEGGGMWNFRSLVERGTLDTELET